MRQCRDGRRLLLATAWRHAVGDALGGDVHPVIGARALQWAGHERLARVIAHHSGAAERAQAAGLPSVEAEFPAPTGGDVQVLDLLDAEDLVTGPGGECVSPVERLCGVVDRCGPRHFAVRALVAGAERLSRSQTWRALVEDVGPITPSMPGGQG